MPQTGQTFDAESIRKMLCDILHCQDFCPSNGGNGECQQCKSMVEKADKELDKIIKVLEEWEKYTPWPD